MVTPITNFPQKPEVNTTGVNNEKSHIHDTIIGGKLYFAGKIVQTILLRSTVKTATLIYRSIKQITWVPLKCGIYKINGHHTDSADYFKQEYLKTAKVARDLLFIPSVVNRAFNDMFLTREEFVDDIPCMNKEFYLNTDCERFVQQFSSYLHGCKTFEVLSPKDINEFPATSDASLNTIMASHLFKPNTMAINFGVPNVATFVTEQNADGSTQTVKIDAKSLHRAPMHYHPTNGKIQSGVFLVPKNLPEDALQRFKNAANSMEMRTDITCVNTNSRVLKEAGFSIEGVDMNHITFPQALMENLLFRNFFYTDDEGKKHKVHFDIINTTPYSFETFFENVDSAVLDTPSRHSRRNADTEENQRARGEAAKALIEAERRRLAENTNKPKTEVVDTSPRKITVSVPSFLGDAISRIWGRHTIYEVDLSDKKEEISTAFQELAESNKEAESAKLSPFPHNKPSLGTRLKRDIFFSAPVIRFLRRHMMGRADVISSHTQDIFSYLQSTNGARLNYVLLDDKVVLALVSINNDTSKLHNRVSNWALSKHALLSNRQGVYCSGEMWYDESKKCFIMNKDSGTYMPNDARLKITTKLANQFFKDSNYNFEFQCDEITFDK
jgi:hypothetical protein